MTNITAFRCCAILEGCQNEIKKPNTLPDILQHRKNEVLAGCLETRDLLSQRKEMKRWHTLLQKRILVAKESENKMKYTEIRDEIQDIENKLKDNDKILSRWLKENPIVLDNYVKVESVLSFLQIHIESITKKILSLNYTGILEPFKCPSFATTRQKMKALAAMESNLNNDITDMKAKSKAIHLEHTVATLLNEINLVTQILEQYKIGMNEEIILQDTQAMARKEASLRLFEVNVTTMSDRNNLIKAEIKAENDAFCECKKYLLEEISTLEKETQSYETGKLVLINEVESEVIKSTFEREENLSILLACQQRQKQEEEKEKNKALDQENKLKNEEILISNAATIIQKTMKTALQIKRSQNQIAQKSAKKITKKKSKKRK